MNTKDQVLEQINEIAPDVQLLFGYVLVLDKAKGSVEVKKGSEMIASTSYDPRGGLFGSFDLEGPLHMDSHCLRPTLRGATLLGDRGGYLIRSDSQPGKAVQEACQGLLHFDASARLVSWGRTSP